MSRKLRRAVPIVAICLATLVAGCVVYPEGGYYHRYGYYDHDYYRGGGWGWRR